MEVPRKLLEGERVEVRQKEVGLRGSWHPGVVVHVKDSRRTVEYDELLTRDGKKKLREIIPLTENNCMKPAAPAEHKQRGFIRPLPPPYNLSSVRSPKKGLLVDAFHEYAWWEGVLLHDIQTRDEDFNVKILFPEEGDELLCSIKDVRVSQEWDEMSGHWMVCGNWFFFGEQGELDIDSLRSICKQRSSSSKKMWRQRNQLVSLLVQKNQGCCKTVVDNFCPSENDTSDKQVDPEVSSTSDSVPVPCPKGQKGNATRRSVSQKGELSHDGLLKSCTSTAFLMKQSRSAAKKFLMDVGWKIGVRIRTQGISQGMKEAIYIAPDGSKYYSLASACRGWKRLKNLPTSTLEEGISQSLKLLDAYNLAVQFGSSGKRQKTKTGKPQQTCERKVWEETLKGFHVSAKTRKPAKLSCQVEDMKNTLSSVAEKLKKRKSNDEGLEQKTLCTSNCKRRKCTEVVAEQNCRKSRCSLKHEVALVESKGRGDCRMQVLLSSPGQSRTEATQFKKSTVLSWLIDKGIIKDHEPVLYLNRKDGHVMKRGQVTREGIVCKCCKLVFTLSNFEAHAGSKLHRPSANIFLDDGRSITDCQLQACALQDAGEDSLADVSDDTCGVCSDGGELILCDHCPSTFHPNCIGLEVVPDGDWYCPRCSCSGCGHIKMDGNEAYSLYRCDQCELGYHSVCAPESLLLKPMGVAREAWFCGRQCEQIFVDLRRLVGKIISLENGYSWMLLRSMKSDVGLSPLSHEMMAEHNVKLGVAHDVMQECFNPIIDPRTKINLISQALYNRKSKVFRLNYSGFYTLILERGDEMISVATIRVHGARLAEMPLVGTRYQYRRQGMCRRLMQALEQMLGRIGVDKLVLPAVPELLETWTGAFNYQHMTAREIQELSRLNLMTFTGTTLLQKQLRKEPATVMMSQNVDKAEMGFLGLSLDSTFSMTTQKAIYHEVTHLNFQGGQSFSEGQWSNDPNGLSGTLNDGKAKKEDDVQYARVVRARTRSKRLVKSTKWIADGLRELAKDIEISNCSLGTCTGNISSQLNEKRGIVPLSNLATHNLDDPLVPSRPSNVRVDDSLSNFLAEAVFAFSPNHYVKRRKRAKRQEDKENDVTWIDGGVTAPPIHVQL